MKNSFRTVRIPIASFIALTLLLILPTLTPKHAHAAPLINHHSNNVPLITRNSTCDPSNAIVIIWYNNYANAWSDCSPWTYETPGLTNVNEVETSGNSGDYTWFKWYNGPTGKYCTISGNQAHWYSPPGITNITQVEYGPSHPNSQC